MACRRAAESALPVTVTCLASRSATASWDAWHSLTGFFHTGLAVAAHHTLYVNYGVNDS